MRPATISARIFVCKTAADYDRAPATASAEIEKHKNAAKYRGCGTFSATRNLGKNMENVAANPAARNFASPPGFGHLCNRSNNRSNRDI